MHKTRYWDNNAGEHMRKNVKPRFCNPKRYEPICKGVAYSTLNALNASDSSIKQRHEILNLSTCARACDKNVLTTRKNSGVE